MSFQLVPLAPLQQGTYSVPMETNGVLAQLGIAAGLGLLVGMQRQYARSRFGGIRTFPLITVLGTLSALLAKEIGGAWIIGAGFIAVAILAAVSNMLAADEEPRDPGMTTEVTALVMFALGAFAVFAPAPIVLAVGVGVAMLLHAKQGLHGFTGRLGEKDMRAIMLFATITFIILPVVPNRTFGPLNVINPHNTWLMVVLVVGISLGGYVAFRLFGSRAGAVLSGLLGGMISSTATTVTYARRAAENPSTSRGALLVIVIAGGVLFARVLTEVFVVAPDFLRYAGPPLLILLGVSGAMAAGLWIVSKKEAGGLSEPENPTQLRFALAFALLYTGVTFAVAVAQRYFPNSGLYFVAAVSGLTDMHAITLSTSRLVRDGIVPADSGWRAIIIASISNMVFKLGMVTSLGGRRLFSMAAAIAGVQIMTAVLLLILWS